MLLDPARWHSEMGIQIACATIHRKCSAILATEPLFQGISMSSIILGIICGIIFGAISVATMIPLRFEDKRAAMLGAFANRFAIGFVIGAAQLPLPGWASGLIFGLLLSLPDASITKAYAPILGLGVLGGAIIGLVISTWGYDNARCSRYS